MVEPDVSISIASCTHLVPAITGDVEQVGGTEQWVRLLTVLSGPSRLTGAALQSSSRRPTRLVPWGAFQKLRSCINKWRRLFSSRRHCFGGSWCAQGAGRRRCRTLQQQAGGPSLCVAGGDTRMNINFAACGAIQREAQPNALTVRPCAHCKGPPHLGCQQQRQS